MSAADIVERAEVDSEVEKTKKADGKRERACVRIFNTWYVSLMHIHKLYEHDIHSSTAQVNTWHN